MKVKQRKDSTFDEDEEIWIIKQYGGHFEHLLKLKAYQSEQ